MREPSTRILVIGAGTAGLLFTLRLSGKVAHEPVEITLVNDSDTFVMRPSLPEFATNQPVVWRSLPQLLRKTKIQFVQGRVIGLEPSQRRVTVRDQHAQPRDLDYDYLVYALGSMTERQSAPGVEQYAYTLSAQGPLSAEGLRERLPEIAAQGGRVVVCGGGATGIETAAQVASVYPQIKVSLVARGTLASALGKSVADPIRRRLASLGVELIEQSEVRAVHAQSVVLDQQRELACDLCIWTAGFVVSPLAREAGLTVNARDQVLVDPFLRSVSHPHIFAIGDAAMPVENPGVSQVRMCALTAGIMGAHGADCLSALLVGKTPKPLSFAYQAQAIALGQHNAIFFPIYPDDKPTPPYIIGRLGAALRTGGISFITQALLAQPRFPGALVWPGQRRYKRYQRQAKLGHPASRGEVEDGRQRDAERERGAKLEV